MWYFVLLSTVFIASAVSLTAIYIKTCRTLQRLVYNGLLKVNRTKDSKLERRSFKVRTADGIELSGYVTEPPADIRGIIVACHNLGGNKENMSRYVEFLCEAGYRVVSFDFRDHGESQKNKKIRFDHAADLDAIMEYTGRLNYKNLPIGIFGLSMGAATGLIYAARDERVKAVVSDGAPLLYKMDYLSYIASVAGITNPLMKSIFIKFCLWITDINKLDCKIREALAALRGKPILLIAGEKDFINPMRNMEQALAILGSETAELWRIKDANHLTGFYMAKDEYKQRVLSFFDSNMKGYVASYNEKKHRYGA